MSDDVQYVKLGYKTHKCDCGRSCDGPTSKALEIKIVADTNDADYITAISEISDEKLEKIKPLIEAIKKFKPVTSDTRPCSGQSRNYPNSYYEYLRKDLGEVTSVEWYSQFSEEIHELFEDFCPSSEQGFHSIESIEVYEKPNAKRLL